MFHPVGSQPPAVYWRRRLVLVAAVVIVIVLIVMTAKALASDGGGKVASNAPSQAPTVTAVPPATPTSSSPPTTPPTTASSSPPAPVTTPAMSGASGSVPLAPCSPAQLSVAADPGKPAWKIGDEPQLALQVTNTGTTPCVQDVSDSQIELRVYNGASRVWGSHDCKVEPGTVSRTLSPGQPAGFTVTWSGLSSEPSCAGTRQRVGAGTYTLYASLAGHDGKAATFAMK